MQLSQMNQFTLKLKSNQQVRLFSKCEPPHRALVCTIIQGGMDSDSLLMKVAQALGGGGHRRHRMKNQGSSWLQRDKDPSGIKRSCSGPEGETRAALLEQRGGSEMAPLTSAFITPWMERGVGACGRSATCGVICRILRSAFVPSPLAGSYSCVCPRSFSTFNLSLKSNTF